MNCENKEAFIERLPDELCYLVKVFIDTENDDNGNLTQLKILLEAFQALCLAIRNSLGYNAGDIFIKEIIQPAYNMRYAMLNAEN